MSKAYDDLLKWMDSLSNYKTPRIDLFPDLDLYMDQVITFLEKSLGPLDEFTNDKMITSSMINNYVKGNVIPNPVSKKYSRNHLIYIIAICTLKQILPIADISKILKRSDDEAENFFLYDIFRNSQDEAIKKKSNDVNEVIKNLDETQSDELKILALKLAVEANASKMISERILYFFSEKERLELEEIKKKTSVEETKRKQKENEKNPD